MFFHAKKVPLSRAENCIELQEVLVLIHQLHKKENELKKAAEKKGIASVDYKKHEVIARLVNKIDKQILAFNQNKKKESTDHTHDILILVRSLLETIVHVLNQENKILQLPRDSKHEKASLAVYYGAFGVTSAIGFSLLASSFGQLFTLAYLAPKMGQAAVEKTGLNEISPMSFKIMNKLVVILTNINLNLTNILQKPLLNDEAENFDFLCPITKAVIKYSIFCTLDKYCYEKSAIEEWFMNHTTAPMDPSKKIPHGLTAKDVLIKNINFQGLLDKYRIDHPQDDVEPTPLPRLVGS